MLLGGLYTYQTKSIQSGGDPHCILCLKRGEKSEESICHILICCQTYTEIRNIYLKKYEELLHFSQFNFNTIKEDNELLCQFILDPSSMNLQSRIHFNDPILTDLFKISRNVCHNVNVKRLKEIENRRYKH